MTTIPTVERTEEAKCSACARNCTQLCTRCGKNFCAKHLLGHADGCSGYKTVVHKILENDFREIVKQVMEAMLKSI